MSYLKGALVFFILFSFMTSFLMLYPFYLINKNFIRRVISKFIQLCARLILKVMGVEIATDFEKINHSGRLIICNHLSYLDMIIILSKVKTSFITSKEMKETPFLGQICELTGCFYTDRKNKENIKKEVQTVRDALSKGINVTFFPEGTSTNGSELKRFRKPFFYSAMGELKSIDLLSLNYFSVDDEAFSLANRDDICWYDETSFLTHLFRLLKRKKIKVNLSYSNVKVQDDIELLVGDCYDMMKSKLKLI